MLKESLSLLTQLTGHIDVVDPSHLWNSRVTKQGFHAVPPPISKGDTANSTAITQQPPPHTTPTSPIQGASGSVPNGVDVTEGTLAELRQDPNIPSNLLNSAFSHAAKTITGLFTPTKPDSKDSNHEAHAKSETSETTAVEVGHMTLPSPDPKTYS